MAIIISDLVSFDVGLFGIGSLLLSLLSIIRLLNTVMFGGVRATPDIIQWIRKGVDSLTSEQRDYILRNLKKQGVGVGLYLLGYLAFKNISPFHGSVKKKDGKDDDSALGVPKVLSHNPMFEVMKAGATYRSVKDEYNAQMEKRGALEGAHQAVAGVVKENPYVNAITHSGQSLKNMAGLEKATAEIIATGAIPPDLRKLAEQLDSATNNTEVKRKPQNIWETLELGIPGLREKVKTDLEETFDKRRDNKTKSYQERKADNQEEYEKERKRYELAKELGVDYVNAEGRSNPPTHPKRATHPHR
jgi:hypothetical protein